MNKKYESEALMVTHQTMQGLFKIGVIDAAEMKEFDEECLTPESKPKETSAPARNPRPVPAYASGKSG